MKTTVTSVNVLLCILSALVDRAAVNSAGTGVYSEPLTVETSVAGESVQMRAVLL